MFAEVSSRLIALAAIALLAGCTPDGPPQMLGSLEWDRIAMPAEAAEPVMRWAVAEGDRVAAGDVLLELDSRRHEARMAQGRASLAEARARLRELANGARIETIDAARAALVRARAAQIDAESDFVRAAELRERELVAVSALDQALAARDQRRAEAAAAEAQLQELTAGTRPEQIEQAAAAVDAATAMLQELELTHARLTVRAPRAGVVDALPFHPGDQPAVGAELAVLLVGDAPYARVFIPASRRTEFAPGDRLEIRVEGVAEAFTAILRNIRSEASFTPYYALAGDDASRLVYRAEAVLEGERAAALPAGLPLTAARPGDARD